MEKSSFSGEIRSLRIKELLKEKGLKQKDLAEMLGRDPQNLSRDLVSGTVSDKTCRKIVELFPDYRIEWILGYPDEAKTHYEWADNIQLMKDLTANSMWCIIENSLKKEGKSLKFVHRQGQHLDSSERLRADCYYSIVDGEGRELKRLTALEMVRFEQKIQSFCDFLTKDLLSSVSIFS